MASNRDRLIAQFARKQRDPFGTIGGSAGSRIKDSRPAHKPKAKRSYGGHDPGYYRMAKRAGWVERNGELVPDDGSGRGRALR